MTTGFPIYDAFLSQVGPKPAMTREEMIDASVRKHTTAETRPFLLKLQWYEWHGLVYGGWLMALQCKVASDLRTHFTRIAAREAKT
tara:strand:- start:29543 stop:29800 length:258 start_codon:yes stop_codon:yes gene_type:complete